MNGLETWANTHEDVRAVRGLVTPMSWVGQPEAFSPEDLERLMRANLIWAEVFQKNPTELRLYEPHLYEHSGLNAQEQEVAEETRHRVIEILVRNEGALILEHLPQGHPAAERWFLMEGHDGLWVKMRKRNPTPPLEPTLFQDGGGGVPKHFGEWIVRDSGSAVSVTQPWPEGTRTWKEFLEGGRRRDEAHQLRLVLLQSGCEEVSKLHNGLWVHSDLQPKNFAVNPDGNQLVICDYEGVQRQHSPPYIAGTQFYSSHGYSDRPSTVTPADDVFSMGIMLLEAHYGVSVSALLESVDSDERLDELLRCLSAKSEDPMRSLIKQMLNGELTMPEAAHRLKSFIS